MQLDHKPINDGFVHSLSMVYQPTVYRASVLAQMETLRRASGYRVREYCVPMNAGNGQTSIPAFGQIEQQVNTVVGAYLWALSFSMPTISLGGGGGGGPEPELGLAIGKHVGTKKLKELEKRQHRKGRPRLGGGDPPIFIQITDACTESPLFSDYAYAASFTATAPGNGGWNRRNPPMLSQPFLVAAPALLDVEIYNSNSTAVTCQLILHMAEPCLPPDEVLRMIALSEIGPTPGYRGQQR
jgi:hypothetical protein